MEQKKFIDIRELIASKNPKILKWMPGFVLRYLKKILHQEEINVFMNENEHLHNEEYCEAIIKFINIDVSAKNIERIPTDKKIIFAMNHPLGGMDAIALVDILNGKVNNLKFIVNDLLLNLKNLNGIFFGVDKHKKNSGSIRAQLSALFQSDNTICIFPAGLVSRKTKGKVQDLEWKKTFVTLARESDRLVVPVFIEGNLSNFFYRLSNFRKAIGIKANIEMLYLSNEMFKQRGKKVCFTFGEAIDLKSFVNLSDVEIAQKIKTRVYQLEKL